MAKGSRGRRRIASRQCRPAPYPLLPCSHDVLKDPNEKKCSKVLEKKDWENATCCVCMEYPHNAVLLLRSSHDKGCRPYMCGTSCRYSNCLDQYKKAYAKVTSLHGAQAQPLNGSVDKCDVAELVCPLCRGQVKGWTVVEPARECLNTKKRSCTQDKCSYIGTYKELKKHVRAEHPSARSREVDPADEQKWRRLEHERERDDVMSTIRSSIPGAVIFGDYVIEGSHYGFDTDEDEDEDEDDFITEDALRRNGGFETGTEGGLVNVFFLLRALGPRGNVGPNRGNAGDFDALDQDSDDDNDDGDIDSLSHRGRLRLGRPVRRLRLRGDN